MSSQPMLTWEGDAMGHVRVSGPSDVELTTAYEIARFAAHEPGLSPGDLHRLGRYLYFMLIRDVRDARGGRVLDAADRAIDSFYPLPADIEAGIDSFKAALWDVRAEEGYALFAHASRILGT